MIVRVAARGRFSLTEPKSIWAEIDYFHANPARRGLCDTPTAWPWSSARELEQPGSGLLRLDLSSLPRTLQGWKTCPRRAVGHGIRRKGSSFFLTPDRS